jgi:hypothetical protein
LLFERLVFSARVDTDCWTLVPPEPREFGFKFSKAQVASFAVEEFVPDACISRSTA